MSTPHGLASVYLKIALRRVRSGRPRQAKSLIATDSGGCYVTGKRFDAFDYLILVVAGKRKRILLGRDRGWLECPES
jgi:hypothetical protein